MTGRAGSTKRDGSKCFLSGSPGRTRRSFCWSCHTIGFPGISRSWTAVRVTRRRVDACSARCGCRPHGGIHVFAGWHDFSGRPKQRQPFETSRKFSRIFAIVLVPVILLGLHRWCDPDQPRHAADTRNRERRFVYYQTGRMDVRVPTRAAQDELQNLVILFNKMLE